MSDKSSEIVKRVHVIKRRDGWVIRKEGSKRATKRFDTKKAALDGSQRYLKAGNDVIVHRKNGTIEKWQRAQ